jgi:hypothetical protein
MLREFAINKKQGVNDDWKSIKTAITDNKKLIHQYELKDLTAVSSLKLSKF